MVRLSSKYKFYFTLVKQLNWGWNKQKKIASGDDKRWVQTAHVIGARGSFKNFKEQWTDVTPEPAHVTTFDNSLEINVWTFYKTCLALKRDNIKSFFFFLT